MLVGLSTTYTKQVRERQIQAYRNKITIHMDKINSGERERESAKHRESGDIKGVGT